MTYQFSTQLERGQSGEQIVREWLSRDYQVIPAMATDQKRGVDFLCQHKVTGQPKAVEVKTDWAAASTGNAFIETISVLSPDTQKWGWAFTCQADELFYLVANTQELIVLDPQRVRQALPNWCKGCRVVYTENDGYLTQGLLLPLPRLRAIAKEIVQLGGEQ